MIYTKRQAKITLSVPGVTIDNKSWDKFSGGGHEADTGNYPPGGMQPSQATQGVTKRNQATVERAYDDVLIGAYLGLDGSVNMPCSVGVTPLRTATTSAGSQRTFTGLIRSVAPVDTDSTSSDVQMLIVVIELNEPIT